MSASASDTTLLGNRDSIEAEQRQQLRLALACANKKFKGGGNTQEIAVKLYTTIVPLMNVAEPQNFATMTSAELDAADLHTTYLVEDVLAKGQPCVIAASKKSLKTTIAIDLALSLASAAMFLNQFYVPRAVRVGMMSGESGDAVIQETARRIARSKPLINLADYGNVIWSFELPRIGQPQTTRDLIKFITDQKLEVLIVDPAYLCMDLGDNASNLFAVGKQLIELTDVMRETGCTIIIVHHCKKSIQSPFAAPELEDIAWAGFQEWARQWILLGRREGYDPENAGSHKLWLSVGGSAGHSGLWAVDVEEGSLKDRGGRRWDVSIQTASVAKAEAADEKKEAKALRQEEEAEKGIKKNAAKLLEAYKLFPAGETASFIRDTAGMNGTRFGPANALLLKEGSIIACTVKKNGQSYAGYCLKDITRTTRTESGLHSDCPGESESQTPPGQTPPVRGVSERECASDIQVAEESESAKVVAQSSEVVVEDWAAGRSDEVRWD